jgi:hypothetical protein
MRGVAFFEREKTFRTRHRLRGKERKIDRLGRTFLSQASHVIGRSFFPLFAITIIAGVTIWGPWVSLTFTIIAIAAALRLL